MIPGLFLWHMLRTHHDIRFDGETWATHCECGRVFYPVGQAPCRTCGLPERPWRHISRLSGRCARCVARGRH